MKNTIPQADLPVTSPGTVDYLVGVAANDGASRLFPVRQMPPNSQQDARLAALEQGQAEGLLGYPTLAALNEVTGAPVGALAMVTNDILPSNNGTYRWAGSEWAKVQDRYAEVDERVNDLVREISSFVTVGTDQPITTGLNMFTSTVDRLFTEPVSVDGVIDTVELWNSRQTQTCLLVIKRFTKSGAVGSVSVGDTFTQVGSSKVIAVPPSPVTGGSVLRLSVGMDVNEGEYIGWFIPHASEQPDGWITDIKWEVNSTTPTQYAALDSAGVATDVVDGRRAMLRFNVRDSVRWLSRIEEAVLDLDQRGTIGTASDIVMGDEVLPSGVNRVLTTPIAVSGRVTSMDLYNLRESSTGLLTFRRFTKAGDPGLVAPGDVFTQVGEDVTVEIPPSYTPFGREMSVDLDFEVRAGEYLGFYAPPPEDQPEGFAPALRYLVDSESPTPYTTVDPFVPPNGAAATTVSNRQIQLRLNVAGAIAAVDDRVERMRSHLPVSVRRPEQLPAPAEGRLGVVVAPSAGPVWADGSSWRWVRDNSLVGLYVSAQAATTMRLSDAQLVFEKNPDEPLPPASTTKMVTAIIVRQNVGNLDETVAVEEGDLAGGSTAQLQAGDIISIRDLLYGLMLPSGNDAARCLGRVVGDMLSPGGGRSRFVSEMNSYVASIGGTGSNFMDPAGAASNRTTAHDLALVAAAYDADPVLVGIGGALSRMITVTGPNARTYAVSHTINPSAPVPFPEFIWGKTGTFGGYGSVAMVWSHAGARYCTVVLRAQPIGERFHDLRRLIDDVIGDA